MHRDTSSWLLPTLLAAGVVAAAWYYWSSLARQDAATSLSPPQSAESQPMSIPKIAPLHPMSDTANLAETPPDLRPLPELNDSDEYFKLELTDLFGEHVGTLIAASRLIDRVVATVDNLPRGHVAERMRPVGGLADSFDADPEGRNQYTISESSFRRYDPLVAIIDASNIEELTDLYRRYYPLFQKAYTELGYPNGYFNDRLVEAIDDMLATPEKSDDLLLVRPHVLYEFADAEIESRSSGQKLLLRMGSENSAKIKTKLRDLRIAIASDGHKR